MRLRIISMPFDDEEDQLINPGNRFAEGITELHASWPYQNIAPGTDYRRIWYLNGESFAEGGDIGVTVMFMIM